MALKKLRAVPATRARLREWRERHGIRILLASVHRCLDDYEVSAMRRTCQQKRAAANLQTRSNPQLWPRVRPITRIMLEYRKAKLFTSSRIAI